MSTTPVYMLLGNVLNDPHLRNTLLTYISLSYYCQTVTLLAFLHKGMMDLFYQEVNYPSDLWQPIDTSLVGGPCGSQPPAPGLV